MVTVHNDSIEDEKTNNYNGFTFALSDINYKKSISDSA